jgi:alkanesulfonate monooxygenase SsuD/methylene tetrahydromethanopterin reductase-like flavin-dependent oxidoreductase (luciferase family)
MAWMADSQLYTTDPWIALTLAGVSTKTIRLGPGVTNPATRHFTVTACTSAALAEVSDGRSVLGIGTGDAAVFPLGLQVKVEDLRRTIERIRTLSEGGISASRPAADVCRYSLPPASLGCCAWPGHWPTELFSWVPRSPS